jgi:hypothetical protein
VAGLSRHPQKDDKKGEICLVQSARGRTALAGRFFLRMRYFPLMLYASAENRDWGVGCIGSRSPSSTGNFLHWRAVPADFNFREISSMLGAGCRVPGG